MGLKTAVCEGGQAEEGTVNSTVVKAPIQIPLSTLHIKSSRKERLFKNTRYRTTEEEGGG